MPLLHINLSFSGITNLKFVRCKCKISINIAMMWHTWTFSNFSYCSFFELCTCTLIINIRCNTISCLHLSLVCKVELILKNLLCVLWVSKCYKLSNEYCSEDAIENCTLAKLRCVCAISVIFCLTILLTPISFLILTIFI